MYSFAFPTMLTNTRSTLLSDLEAVRSNLKLTLQSERLSLFGDPFFGTQLKRLIFEQSHSIVVDLVVDEIYTTIITFIPQVYLSREDIELTTNGVDLFVTIHYVYLPNNTSDLYKINLTNYETVK